MKRLEDTDRLLQAAAVDAGVMPELVVQPAGAEWVVRHRHSNATVRFASRDEAAAFAKTWAAENPPCLLKFANAAS